MLGFVLDDAKFAHFPCLAGEFPDQPELLSGHAQLYRALGRLGQEGIELALQLKPGVVLVRAEGEGAVSDDSIKLDSGLHVQCLDLAMLPRAVPNRDTPGGTVLDPACLGLQ